jgi:transposase
LTGRLERLVADGKTPQKVVKRASIVLLSGPGLATDAICREARVSKPTVWRWRTACREGGVERLLKDKEQGRAREDREQQAFLEISILIAGRGGAARTTVNASSPRSMAATTSRS